MKCRSVSSAIGTTGTGRPSRPSGRNQQATERARTVSERKPGHYVGRFAPSPTGPLHFGSLLAACASYLQARASGGRWLLRIEDIDPPREQPGAAQSIVETLAAFGFEWDGPVHFQSARRTRHRELIEQLQRQGYAYPCSCSRSNLALAPRGPLGTVYPGTCRKGSSGRRVAIRLLTDAQPVSFSDSLQGPQSQCLESETGDFIIRRRDGLIAYHLAVVADDHDQGVTETFGFTGISQKFDVLFLAKAETRAFGTTLNF